MLSVSWDLLGGLGQALSLSGGRLEMLASFSMFTPPWKARDGAGDRQGLSQTREAMGEGEDSMGASGARWQIFKLKYIYTLDK